MIAYLLVAMGAALLFGAAIAGLQEFHDWRKMRRRQRARREEFRQGVRYRAWREAAQLGTWLP